MKLKVKKLHTDAIIPNRAHPTDSGLDLYALDSVEIKPGQTVIVKTGISFDIPAGFEVQVRPRSGLSAKSKLRLANSIGTVDSGYQGDISVIAFHSGFDSDSSIIINKGDKIAQAVICPVMLWETEEVETFEKTERGSNGFGSTGN